MEITRAQIDPAAPTRMQCSRRRLLRWALTGKPPIYVGQKMWDEWGHEFTVAWVDGHRFGTADGLESRWNL